MPAKVDARYLHALLGSAGKSIASQPGAKNVVARMKLAASPEDFAYVLQNVDLGLDRSARDIIWEAAANKTKWREAHATLVRSAELHIIERFSASS